MAARDDRLNADIPADLAAARAHAERLPLLSEDGMWLHFVGHGVKWYAQTPLGEYAFGDAQGLYEWRRGPDGRPERVDYTGGDRVGASNGQMWISGTGGTGKPKEHGLAYAQGPRLN